MSERPIIIIGAGQAGVQIIDSLRRGGYDGALVLIGDEHSLPYQRPPLSKQYLSGALAEERLLFRPENFYVKQDVEVLLGTRVSELHPAARTVSLEGGSVREYEKLALTTGASVRRLPVLGAELEGVRYLRSLEDARHLRARLGTGALRVVAIGGGFIGLELAAAARELGHAVTVVEAQDRLMARVVAPVVSDYYLQMHRAQGVEVLLNAAVERIDDNAGTMAVVLADGNETQADLVVVGIGSVPHSELAEAAGLECDNGIVVDEFARTSDSNIVAAGDCTMHQNSRLAVRQRLESVQNAVDQAKVAAATLLGETKPYDQIPWFWSDQFQTKLQMVGSSAGFDRYVVRGSIDDAAFSVFYFRGDVLSGVDSINRPADHLVSRKLLAAGTKVPIEMIEDLDQNLKSLL